MDTLSVFAQKKATGECIIINKSWDTLLALKENKSEIRPNLKKTILAPDLILGIMEVGYSGIAGTL